MEKKELLKFNTAKTALQKQNLGKTQNQSLKQSGSKRIGETTVKKQSKHQIYLQNYVKNKMFRPSCKMKSKNEFKQTEKKNILSSSIICV